MINIKQPPGVDLIGQRDLYNYLSELATELNREILTIEERLSSLDQRVTALENE